MLRRVLLVPLVFAVLLVSAPRPLGSAQEGPPGKPGKPEKEAKAGGEGSTGGRPFVQVTVYAVVINNPTASATPPAETPSETPSETPMGDTPRGLPGKGKGKGKPVAKPPGGKTTPMGKTPTPKGGLPMETPPPDGKGDMPPSGGEVKMPGSEILDLFASENALVRKRAVLLLSKKKEEAKDAIPALFLLVDPTREKDPGVRRAAFSVISEFSLLERAEAFCRVLEDSAQVMDRRLAACRFLPDMYFSRELKDEIHGRIVDALEKGLLDRDPGLQAAAALALEQIDEGKLKKSGDQIGTIRLRIKKDFLDAYRLSLSDLAARMRKTNSAVKVTLVGGDVLECSGPLKAIQDLLIRVTLNPMSSSPVRLLQAVTILPREEKTKP